jgi:hypothetical protein
MLNAALKRRSSTVVLAVLLLKRRCSTVVLASRNEIKSKVKNNVKGSGQECPLHMGVRCAWSHVENLKERIYESAVGGW